MSRMIHPAAELRSEPRLKVPAMYTLMRLKLPHQVGYPLMGHVYDVSLTGMRFELDEVLPKGQLIDARVMLPGLSHVRFGFSGRVVRHVSDLDEPGPARMGLAYTAFETALDEHRLKTYLAESGVYALPRAEAA